MSLIKRMSTARSLHRAISHASALYDAQQYEHAGEVAGEAAELASSVGRANRAALAWTLQARACQALRSPGWREPLDRALGELPRIGSEERALIAWEARMVEASGLVSEQLVDEAARAYSDAISAVSELISGLGGLFANQAYHRIDQSRLNLATLEHWRGDVSKALATYADVIDSSRRRKDGPVLLGALVARAAIQLLLDEYDDAHDCLEAFFHYFPETDFSSTHPIAIMTLVLRAATEYAKGQALAGSVDEAIDNLEQACELAERVPEAATARAEALGMLGRAHLVSGRAERAAECARAAADLASADPVITADAQAVLGTALFSSGRFEAARQAVRAGLDGVRGVDAPLARLELLALDAEICTAVGRHDEAVALIRDAVGHLVLASGRTGTTGHRRRLLSAQKSYHQRFLDMAVIAAEQGVRQAGLAALEASEAAREDTLAALLRQTSGTLRPQLAELLGQIDRLRVLCVERPASSTAETARFGPPLSYWEKRLGELQSELGQMVSGEFSRLYVPVPLDAEALIAASGTAAILSVTATDDDSEGLSGVVTWSIPGSAPGARRFELSVKETRILHSVMSNDRRFGSRWDQVRDGVAAQLIPAPLRDWLLTDTSVRELNVVADHTLRALPVAALPLSADTVVADHAAVNRLPLLRLLLHKRAVSAPRAPAAATRVVAYFNPELPGSMQELRALRDLAATGAVELTLIHGAEELAPALERTSPDVLVLSTHGSGEGLAYAFQFVGGRPLVCADLLGLPLPPFFVAAACSSGSDAGADPTGLIATALATGCCALAAGAWDLPDASTAKILRAVYGAIAPSGRFTVRINEAVKSVYRSLPRESPVDWAGLMVTELPEPKHPTDVSHR
ncbi:CHAT domain-containing protein [Streptomyces europaeiscabiei]|uniref:CHAT domain-containing protein n=1 Tax=Streptomyces europaeiscabiei TaxID=146819 RepID=UPI0029BCCCE3|nr:CHAT domain-containing protein [Streptomyces europaeiscabiei]MDX3783005.1 CHAT domain-containing protein [Streptomyces europaeiscabiei]